MLADSRQNGVHGIACIMGILAVVSTIGRHGSIWKKLCVTKSMHVYLIEILILQY